MSMVIVAGNSKLIQSHQNKTKTNRQTKKCTLNSDSQSKTRNFLNDLIEILR